jgi:hypothetical protein
MQGRLWKSLLREGAVLVTALALMLGGIASARQGAAAMALASLSSAPVCMTSADGTGLPPSHHDACEHCVLCKITALVGADAAPLAAPLPVPGRFGIAAKEQADTHHLSANARAPPVA